MYASANSKLSLIARIHILTLLSQEPLLQIRSVHVRRASHGRRATQGMLLEPIGPSVLVVAARRMVIGGFGVVVDTLQVFDQPEQVFGREVGAGPSVHHLGHQAPEQVAVALEIPLDLVVLVLPVVHAGDGPAVVCFVVADVDDDFSVGASGRLGREDEGEGSHAGQVGTHDVQPLHGRTVRVHVVRVEEEVVHFDEHGQCLSAELATDFGDWRRQGLADLFFGGPGDRRAPGAVHGRLDAVLADEDELEDPVADLGRDLGEKWALPIGVRDRSRRHFLGRGGGAMWWVVMVFAYFVWFCCEKRWWRNSSTSTQAAV